MINGSKASDERLIGKLTKAGWGWKPGSHWPIAVISKTGEQRQPVIWM